MYKDPHNRILRLPRGTPVKTWVNTAWMLVFSPFLLVLGAFVIFAVGAIAYTAFMMIFK
ncbi:MAG: hypothetical protein KDB82_18320 [Planctomycetes bacterium]|nr:hypothetical protein [Planctomycetota bacterium]